MTTILEHFRDGGWGMFPTLLFGLLLLAVATRYAMRPDARMVPLLLSVGALTLATGALGFVSGLIATCTYIDRTSVEAPRIAIIGFGESLNNVAFALIFVALAAVWVAFGAWKLGRKAALHSA